MLAEWGRTTDQTKIDSAGRVTLPNDWAQRVGIEKSTKVVLVGAVSRDFDPPGTIRRYEVDLTPPKPDEVCRSVEESVMVLVDEGKVAVTDPVS